MKMKRNKKLRSFILCMVLMVAMALATTGCNDKPSSNAVTTEGTITAPQEDNVQHEEVQQSDAKHSNVLGEGNTVFPFSVVDKDGSETTFEIHTDKETVGEALLEVGLIAGDNSEYGLYVKTVNGITVDYDTDGMYWAFYVNGEYAMSGVDTTPITEGESYSFRVEKRETDDKGNRCLCNARRCNVCLKNYYGVCTQYSFNWCVYHCFYSSLSE